MRDSQPFQQPIRSLPDLTDDLLTRLDTLIQQYSVSALRVSIGVVFLWFGVLKFFPELSPAEEIATLTLVKLTFGLLPDRAALLGLATFETAIGLCFVTGRLRSFAVPLLFLHMCGTAIPFLLFPARLFYHVPYAPTFEGQYLAKNLIIVCAAAVLQKRWR